MFMISALESQRKDITAVGHRKELCIRHEFYDEQIPETMDLTEFICKGYNSFLFTEKS